MDLGLNEGLYLNLCEIKVKDGTVTTENIVDFEIYWDIHNLFVNGYLVFMDTFNIIEHQPVLVNDIIDVYFEDVLETEYKQQFVIQKLNKSYDPKGKPIVMIEFIDQNALSFMKTYECKGYKDTPIQDVITEYFDNYKIDDKSINDESTEAKWGNDEDKTLIVPGDRSWFKTLNRYVQENDLLYFNNREEVRLVDFKTLNAQTPREEVVFRIKTPNEAYMYRIGDIRVENFDGLKNKIVTPDIEVFSYDYKAGKKLIKTEIDFKSSVSDSESLGDTDIDITEASDYRKIVFNNHNSQRNEYTQKKYTNRAINIVITSNGTFENNIGDIVELELETAKPEDGIDENLSGMYLITKITDKIEYGSFIQQITLSRAKNM